METKDLEKAKDFFTKCMEEQNKEIKLSPDNWYDIFTVMAKYKALTIPIVSNCCKENKDTVIGKITEHGFTTPNDHGYLKIHIPYGRQKIKGWEKNDKIKLVIVD